MSKSFRFAGEFERKTFPRYSVELARALLMRACVHVEPQVLTSLLEDPMWATVVEGGYRPDGATADSVLRKWGERWNLSDAWCLDWAYLQLATRWNPTPSLGPTINRTQTIAAVVGLGTFSLVSGPSRSRLSVR